MKCSVPDCDRDRKARGWCLMHYKRWRKTGSPFVVLRSPLPESCAVEGCAGKPAARGWCQKHYKRWKEYGDPRETKYAVESDIRGRFFHYYKPPAGNECSEWAGPRNGDGYGHLFFEGRGLLAHRVAFEIHVAPIGEGQVVRHACDNKPCVNPRHLLIGYHIDNMRDAVARGRTPRGSRHGLSKLTEEQVTEIRRRADSRLSALGREFNVSASTIRQIVKRKTWTHI